MDAQAVLTALDAGDFTALVTALGPDESQDFVIPVPPGMPDIPADQRTITLALMGATVLKIGPGTGASNIEAHGHATASEAAECYRRGVANVTEQLGVINSLVAAVTGPGSRDANPPRWV